MTRTLFAAAIGAALTAAPAFAQEEPPVLNFPLVATQNATVDWTGFSVGAQIGFVDAETNGVADLNGEEVSFGLRAYYDYDFGTGFVIGGGIQFDGTDVNLDGAASIDEVLRIGARAGFASGRNWYYGTAGYARAFTDAGTLNVGDSDGFFAGVGYEVFLVDNVTAGVEVLYHEFDDFDVPGLDAQVTTVGFSLNYRF